MASAKGKVVAVDHIGGREQVESEWQTIRAVFHDFETLRHERGDCTKSARMECLGHKWAVRLYPGGHGNSNEEEEHISIYLSCTSLRGDATVKAGYVIRIRSANIKRGRGRKGAKKLFKNGSNTWGYANYATRSDVLDSSKDFLVNGNLEVEVDIQIMLDAPAKIPVWTPPNTLGADMLAMLEHANAENADLRLQISTNESEETSDVYVHKAILQARAPALAALAEDCDVTTPAPINDTDPVVFKQVLRFVYGGELPSEEQLRVNAQTFIRAANRFGITGLKLTAEAELASAGICTENAAELILFADGNNCALLKEAAIEYFVSNSEAVMNSEGYAKVEESPAVLSELMKVTVGGSKKRPLPSDGADANPRDYKRMCVSVLRQKVDEKGLDVDGSREMLISRLEESNSIDIV